MNQDELKQLWLNLRRQPQRYPLDQDYRLVRSVALLSGELGQRFERYSLDCYDAKRVSLSDMLLGVFCWLQAEAMHIKELAERQNAH